ncbi:MAG: BamA/TamA family outer membrane protein, partial [Flavobacteriaceae bacterium]
LNERNSIFIKNHTRFLNSPNYLTNELFRFGGINSLRGFRENSIDASLFSALTTEYRYLLDQNAYVHSIIDIAYFENETVNINEELYGFGLGLGLNTKAGLFKFNIANGFSKNQSIRFDNTRIHIIYITRF